MALFCILHEKVFTRAGCCFLFVLCFVYNIIISRGFSLKRSIEEEDKFSFKDKGPSYHQSCFMRKCFDVELVNNTFRGMTQR